MSAGGPNCILIRTPARLHLGFLDLNGNLGRRFGSIGLALTGLCTELTGTRAGDQLEVSGPDRARVHEYARRLMVEAGLAGGVRLNVMRAIPGHAGLGSGTQLALATGVALCRLFNLRLSIDDVARLLGRGHRSGIGVGTFQHGGFILDGGRGSLDAIPPVLCRLPVPEAWRFLLILNREGRGISGDPEDDAFAHLPQMDADCAAEICRLVLMQVLPALAEVDCGVFGSAITRIQDLIGRHFAGVQSGPYADPGVQDVLRFLSEQGAAGIGQSSWGPTGFAIYASETMAFHALRGVRDRWRDSRLLDFVLCRAQNQPAEIHVDDALAGRIRLR